MAKRQVPCKVEYTEFHRDTREIPGVIVTCNRCGNSVESFGQTERSLMRCYALLRENCDNEENNFYYNEEDGPP